jgi:hypothetical protein
MSIYITRGDSAAFSVMAENGGAPYVFQPGEVVRFKVTERKNCTNVVLQKDVAVEEETDNVIILLDKVDTKIGEVISKPVDYWYEVERNPHTDPQTIIGYDEDGAKIFKLFPEGNDELPNIDEEDIPLIDDTLSLTSERPIQNQAVSRALFGIIRAIEMDEDVPTEEYYGMKGATEDEDGSGGMIPAPKMGEQDFVLYGDGTWRKIEGKAQPPVTVVSIPLLASSWVGSGNLYSQIVSVKGIKENSQVNLTPSVEQLAVFYEKDITFVTENDGGVLTVYVIGQKPQNDYTIQASIVEVIV